MEGSEKYSVFTLMQNARQQNISKVFKAISKSQGGFSFKRQLFRHGGLYVQGRRERVGTTSGAVNAETKKPTARGGLF